MPAVTASTSWMSAATPIPMTLPASRCRAGTRTRSTSTTAVDFSSTTPVST